MKQAAVCFDTWHGHSAKIADQIAQQFIKRGFKTEVFAVREGATPPFAFLDAVVVVAPVHSGKYSKFVRRFVKHHQLGLFCVPSMFISVSLAAAGDDSQQDEARLVMNRFLEETKWSPTQRHSAAGELAYRRYGRIKRWLMRWILSRAGGSTDTSRNHDYTQWGELVTQVGRFIDIADATERLPLPKLPVASKSLVGATE